METCPLYVFYSPQKTFTPSHKGSFFLIFSGFKCEGLNIQAFTAEGACVVYILISRRFPGVKACSFKPSQVNHFGKRSTISENSQPKSGKVTFTARVKALKSNHSHSKPMKINRKRTLCEGVNAFFGK